MIFTIEDKTYNKHYTKKINDIISIYIRSSESNSNY